MWVRADGSSATEAWHWALKVPDSPEPLMTLLTILLAGNIALASAFSLVAVVTD